MPRRPHPARFYRQTTPAGAVTLRRSSARRSNYRHGVRCQRMTTTVQIEFDGLLGMGGPASGTPAPRCIVRTSGVRLRTIVAVSAVGATVALVVHRRAVNQHCLNKLARSRRKGHARLIRSFIGGIHRHGWPVLRQLQAPLRHVQRSLDACRRISGLDSVSGPHCSRQRPACRPSACADSRGSARLIDVSRFRTPEGACLTFTVPAQPDRPELTSAES